MKNYFEYFAAFLLLAATMTGAMTVEPGIAARIAAARLQIAKNPAQPDSYISLALALIKAARATDCDEYLKQAEQAVADALRLAPNDGNGNFEALKARVALRLAQARFAEALAEAQVLNRKVPDDNQLYGYLADARMALGDYAAAEKSVQWMIDQRPVNVAGLERGAMLRDDFGYGEPSLEWWSSALHITGPADAEERAWILVNMSRVALRMGKAADAGKGARQAMEVVADYPPAGDALAAALLEQDQASAAAEVLRRRLSAAPDVRAEFHFGVALEASGKTAEAAAVFDRFEKDAIARIDVPDNANRELIEYYATHGQANEAVKLAAEEVRRQQDIPTLSAYALALAAAGRLPEARAAMDRTLAPGIRDARLFLRAGLIAAKLNDKASAATYLRKAIEINASSPEAGKAIEMLAKVD